MFKAYLLLKTLDGSRKEFYLGGYHSISRCLAILENEIDSYDRDSEGKFYTNPEFTYGGFKTNFLTVEHKIIGVRCGSDLLEQ
jgi:hypothetical protein